MHKIDEVADFADDSAAQAQLLERALETTNLRRENRRLRAQAITPEGLLGKSMPAQQLRQMIAKLAGANSRVLISGPPGAGKETVARLIHGGSHRARNEFVAISAAGMTPERMDLELFGEEGAGGRPAKIGVRRASPTGLSAAGLHSQTSL